MYVLKKKKNALEGRPRKPAFLRVDDLIERKAVPIRLDRWSDICNGHHRLI